MAWFGNFFVRTWRIKISRRSVFNELKLRSSFNRIKNIPSEDKFYKRKVKLGKLQIFVSSKLISKL
jgi:hypothetical protein